MVNSIDSSSITSHAVGGVCTSGVRVDAKHDMLPRDAGQYLAARGPFTIQFNNDFELTINNY
jgi:hypothetical protein